MAANPAVNRCCCNRSLSKVAVLLIHHRLDDQDKRRVRPKKNTQLNSGGCFKPRVLVPFDPEYSPSFEAVMSVFEIQTQMKVVLSLLAFLHGAIN